MFVSGAELPPDEPPLRCSRCGQLKPADQFNWHRKERGQRGSYCRPCRAEYHREHYSANKQRYIDNAAEIKRQRRLERSRYLIDYFRSHPCVDCGETDPLVLEFDHRGDKLFTIGSELGHRNWQAVLAEIAKCDVVCSNCHRRRTWRERGTTRLLVAESDTQSDESMDW